MSIDQIIRQIGSLDREINSLERSIQSIDSNLNRKQKEVHAILEKINREKNLNRVINYQRDLQRKNDEINRLEKQKSPKSKSLADKQKKKYELQSKIVKEEQKERIKAQKEQKELLSIQKQITREMQRQKSAAFLSNQPSNIIPPSRQYDVFISHASEDKEDFVRPFAHKLKDSGLEVWYDEFELHIGDSLRRTIDQGLSNSTFGIVVLSNSFFSKEWPQKELDGLFAREVEGEKVILPIWHKISKNEVMNYSPIIADKMAINTSSFTIDEIAEQIIKRINK